MNIIYVSCHRTTSHREKGFFLSKTEKSESIALKWSLSNEKNEEK